ncbi:MAG: NAD-dependent epimerase/dehydratase family protein [Planctomycetota bacterium]|jgi:UDP-glucose 4-epimerase|nr:NAD-dependent epimerase/dehydratase family protein [Planctomycetota bacterium]
MPGKKILLTGCAGFIGRHLLERLLAEGHAVRGIDDFSTGDRGRLAALGKDFDLIEGDLGDPAKAAAAVRGRELVIHLASRPSVPRSLAHPRESALASVLATVTLLEAAARAGAARVVQAASSSAYGDSPVFPRRESAPPRPLSPYAAAKLAQEAYAAAFFRCRGLDSVSLRYFNVFGPGQNPAGPYAAVIARFIGLMAAGRRPEIYGDGGQTRDFTYVADVVEANLAAALHPRPLEGEVVNVGSGRRHSLRELIDLLNDILGTSLEPVCLPARPGDVRDSLAEVEKARRLFGFEAATPFRRGLELTVAARLRENRF